MAATPNTAHTTLDEATGTRPALTALLDHLAEELAREYVRLMEAAAHADAAAGLTLPPEES